MEVAGASCKLWCHGQQATACVFVHEGYHSHCWQLLIVVIISLCIVIMKFMQGAINLCIVVADSTQS